MKGIRSLLSKLFLALFLTIVISGCAFSAAPLSMVNKPIQDWILITKDPDALPTPTPFQPIAKTPINTLAPTQDTIEDSEVQGEVGESLPKEFETPEGQINILLLGSDYRPGGGFRTDVIMLVGINTITNKVSVLSFPRDLCVYIPGTYSGYDLESCDRINTAMQFGFQTTQNTFESNFGVKPDYYAMTNFQGFVTLIDNLGGVDVEVASNLTDECSLPQASGGYCTMYAGTNSMNGATALWYVRSRYSSSDYDRERRAQEMIQALFHRLLSLDTLNKIPSMFDVYSQYVEHNLPLDVVLALGKVAANIDLNEDVYRETLEPPEVIDTRKSNGAYVSLPNHTYIDPIIQRAFFSE